ncbi:M20 family metallopeptidase [Pusillimonas sp. MFBS29]|uniref:M20 family metallopeptidase n=1 Tax=Pusillimonas sp. MFBS29 TaxID=2886690 RepID=UPI001D12AA6F|nr:M20 family metallopeptidase [Pusillimonas sp. MFBS29]MCC2596102.1 M20 family metallopeptidase [Pusillimonas sp. MFBS29]
MSQPDHDTTPLLEMIERWVRLESPSHSDEALQDMAQLIVADARGLGLNVDLHDLGSAGAPLVHIHNRAAGDDRPGILVLGHYDTVHPVGILEKNALRREGDKLYGPGIYDMKAGICLALVGLAKAQQSGGTALPVDLVILPDEETGSHRSRTAIEDYARKSRYALVCEPARADRGRCVTARKGTGFITVKAHGRPAHAGMQHQKGRNAIEEIAHQVLALQAMTDYERGITVSVGVVKGGTTPNVVPEHCEIRADFRLPDPEAADELRAKVNGLQARVPDVELDVVFELNRPPMPRTEGTVALLKRCQAYAAAAGLDLDEAPMTGGASDANFTAALGLPTLDGLGADGDGAHTLYEHILVSTLASRQQFWINTLQALN